MKSHTDTHTLNNAEGIIAVAGVLNELCEEWEYMAGNSHGDI